VNLYTAYPDVTAKEIKALAAAADVTGAGELHPFLVILSMKSSRTGRRREVFSYAVVGQSGETSAKK
jgi:hypothetical protein